MTDISASPDPSRDLFVRPGEGRVVRREDGSPWPLHGDWVADTQYVRRRLADGDLIRADPNQAAKVFRGEAEARAKAEADAEASAAQPASAPPPDTATDAARKGRRPATDE
jgi:Protein of unknown function (DUF2635)